VQAFAPLARHFRVLALDQRGHGRGIRPGPLRGFRLEDCADDVVALADVLGVERVIPVGYSMGGPVAQLIWRRHPDRVAGLVLCATSRNFRGTSQPAMAQLAMAGGVAGAAAALRTVPPLVRRRATQAGLAWRRRALGMPEWALAEVARNDPAAMLEGFRVLQAFNSADWIGGVEVPTAVVVTTADQVVPPARQRKLAAAIPGASTWDVAGNHDVCVAGPHLFPPVLVDACRWVRARVEAPSAAPT
jgi:pimeloyl-ACP methyl ester carboxylesterase